MVVGIGVHQQKLARFRQAENERGDAEAQIGEDEIVGVPGRLPKPLGANSRVQERRVPHGRASSSTNITNRAQLVQILHAEK